jgi:16S rRNA (cytosine967-C5)-methyltransferase
MARAVKTLLTHAEVLLSDLLAIPSPESSTASDRPDDVVVSHYFKRHRELGHFDRGFIANTVYAVLRSKRSLTARCSEGKSDLASPRRLLLAAIFCAREQESARFWKYPLAEIEDILDDADLRGIERARAATLDALPPAVRLDLPDWLYECLAARLGEEKTARLAESFNRPAPLDLRINPLKRKRAEILSRLCAEGFSASACPFSPLGIRISGKPSFARHPLFLDGSFEVQDEGSQLLGFLLRPRRGETIVDFCAGAGGKTLLFGALMRSTGRIYALDVSGKRLDRIAPRLERSGLSNVRPVRVDSSNDARIRRFDGKIDRVFVDAPCSGTGTFRRNPGLKWRRTPESVRALADTQAEILESASALVRPGGRLVYATCSVLDAENDSILRGFLDNHVDFTLLPASDILNGYVDGGFGKRGDGNGGKNDVFLRLYPFLHGTDAFFAAVMERAKR